MKIGSCLGDVLATSQSIHKFVARLRLPAEHEKNCLPLRGEPGHGVVNHFPPENSRGGGLAKRLERRADCVSRLKRKRGTVRDAI